MIEVIDYNGEDFKAVKVFEGWKIGLMRWSERFSKADRLERHTETDEVFVLLSGEAVLYTEEETVPMEKNKVYNIKRGVWHHTTMSRDATVLVIENSNTSKENTERRFI